MKKIIKWLDINLEAFIGMIFFYVMLGLILYQIFARAIIGSGLPWGEEICKYCYVWVSYIGIAYATRNSIHIEIDAIRRLLPEKVQKVLMIISYTIMLYLFIRFFGGCMINVIRIYENRMTALTITISQNWMYAAGIVGYGLGIIRCIQNLIWKFRHFRCSMPVFCNPYSVLDGGLYNYCYDDEIREEYRQQVPEEAYKELEEFEAARKARKGGKAS